MKLYITLSKKNLAVIFAAVIIMLIVAGQFFSAESGRIDGSTNAVRVAYLKSCGFEVDDSGVTAKEIVIPESFNDVYTEYNSVQKKSGFDLSRYKGEKATVYTYPVSGDETRQIHLIIYNGQIIGGDTASVKLNGSISPIKN